MKILKPFYFQGKWRVLLWSLRNGKLLCAEMNIQNLKIELDALTTNGEFTALIDECFPQSQN